MKRTQRIGDGTPHSNAIPGTEPGKAPDLSIEQNAKREQMRAAREEFKQRKRASRGQHPKPNRARYKPKPTYPDDMPPMPEWDNPVLKRSVEDFGDNMRLRRARMRGAETGKPVIRRLIIARDRSTCWICKRILTDAEIHLDHVMPISKGGLHEPENVKVACASCNLWKSDRIITP